MHSVYDADRMAVPVLRSRAAAQMLVTRTPGFRAPDIGIRLAFRPKSVQVLPKSQFYRSTYFTGLIFTEVLILQKFY